MQSDIRRWLVLAVVLLGTLMTNLDAAIVNVAIPSIHDDLHARFGDVELVVSAYILTYGCLLVTGGRLGDLYGRKRLFITGLLAFGATSALCGLAPDAMVLIVARALQGIGGALMYPQVLAIIQVTFSGNDRTKALGVLGSVIGIAAIAGQMVGGLLVAADIWGLQWRPIFLVNVPLVLGTVAAAWFVLEHDDPQKTSGLDLGGVALITPALVLLIVPLLEGRELGWPAWTILSLVASLAVSALFFWYERRFGDRGGTPLVPVRLFANRSLAVGVPIAGLLAASYSGFLLILAIYLQIGLDFSPLQSGLIYAPSAAGFLITSLAAPKLVPILERHTLSIGYIIAAIGLIGTAITAAAAGPRLSGFELALPLVIAGLGQGLGLTPLVGRVISGLHPTEAGAGAGIVTTTLQIGNVLGIAMISLLFFALLGHGGSGQAYANAFAWTLPLSAVLLLAAAYLVRLLPQTPEEFGNALLERAPNWGAGLAYSMFLMTGGHIADRLFEDILSHVAERRLARARQAPDSPGEFLAFHFREGHVDEAWLRYLMREALSYRAGPVPHEAERNRIIAGEIDETRRRQQLGLLPSDVDAALLRLFAFAVVTYPRLLPQMTRMTAGMPPEDPRFVEAWEQLLRRVGDLLKEDAQRRPMKASAATG